MFRLLAYFQNRRLEREILLSTGEQYSFGRGTERRLAIDWDPRISRYQGDLTVHADRIELTQHPAASNVIYVNGSPIRQCRLGSGDSFVVGDTRFELQQVTQSDSPGNVPVRQTAIRRNQLQRIRYEDADKRIEVLTSLPAVIRESGVERDLYVALAGMLLAGIQMADGVAIVSVSPEGRVRTLHYEQRFETGDSFHPSSRLISNAIQEQNSILHIWDSPTSEHDQFTQMAGFSWAFCTPLSDAGGDRAFYVTGRSMSDNNRVNEQWLHADIKFTEFIADIVSSLNRQRQLERQQTGLRQFFSPPILEALGSDLDTSLLEPRECDVTVLFCDLRGFSHRAEEEADNLTGLLERVSLALEVMTSQILRFGGVTGDFQGDAALGFWGWPIASEESPINACRAALAIREAFMAAQHDPDHPLKDFETSIGIACGRAVAGKIGTREQVKVTVFGPVVNLASRLESMTRELHVPILIDDTLDQFVRSRMPPSEGRVRRLLNVLPYGMDRNLTVSELVPPQEHVPALTDQHLQDFEKGLQCFVEGRWADAWKYLHSMPAEDRAQDFLSMLITQHDRKAPPDWDGIVRIKKKSG
ncbi:MAG: adenylate/guanylate cyclase domain-containing protein [Planctomycetaceae bacterium]|nr:adenylate/guanylate cyclase domain-containing protein [Planctomycetaceae bacterium]